MFPAQTLNQHVSNLVVCVCVFTSVPLWALEAFGDWGWGRSAVTLLPLLQPPLSEQSRWTPPVPSHCVCAHQDGLTGTLPSLPSSSTLPSAIFGGGYKYL